MNFDTFQTQISYLTNTFGSSCYHPYVKMLLWYEVNNLSDDWFESLVKDLLLSEESPPLPHKIIDAAVKEELRVTQNEYDQYKAANDPLAKKT